MVCGAVLWQVVFLVGLGRAYLQSRHAALDATRNGTGEDASWLPLILARSSNFSNLFAFQRDNRLIRDPVEAFGERCFIGFESDETLVYRLWDVFQDIAIWSSDYPHHDAEDTWDALAHMAELKVPEAVQKKLLGENARRLYGIEPAMRITERIHDYEPAILPW